MMLHQHLAETPLVATGRQSSTLVARALRAGGTRRLLAPAYGCLPAVEPFALEGLAVSRLVCGQDLLPVAAGLRALVLEEVRRSPDRPPAVLHVRVFGIEPGPDLVEALAEAAALGCPIVADDTHALLSEARDVAAHYRLASLRKLLPVVDGATVLGLGERPVTAAGPPDARASGSPPVAARNDANTASCIQTADPPHVGQTTDANVASLVEARGPADEAMSAAGWAARRAEQAFCEGADPSRAYLDAADHYEDLVDAATTPVPPSAASLARLARLDISGHTHDLLASADDVRRAARSLGLALLTPPTSPYVVIRVPNAQRIREALAVNDLHPPVWWPRPRRLPVDVEWPQDLIALPTDPAYGVDLPDRLRAILRHGT